MSTESTIIRIKLLIRKTRRTLAILEEELQRIIETKEGKK